ncbi:MAG: CPBP family intramembrane metalloprotease [Mariniblastus sp.]|nr:CPBP family intramembrane metalloprotease [Mariniblastus sp.]
MSEENRPTEHQPTVVPATLVESEGSCLGSALSWFVILGIVAYLFSHILYSQLFPSTEPQEITAAELMEVNLTGQVMIGQTQIDPNSQATSNSQLEPLNKGPVEQRYCYAILVNEIDSAEQALEKLKATDQAVEKANYKLSAAQARLREIIGELLEAYDSGNFDSSIIPKEDRDFLSSKLGWCGELVLVPSGTPHKTMRRDILDSALRLLFVLVGVVLFGIGLLLTGLVSLAVIFYLTVTGKLASRMHNEPQRGSIYLQTFAIWMALFVVLQLLSGLAAEFITDPVLVQLLMPVAFFLSLIVLAWPVVRGISFAEVREDIGLKWGNPLKEIVVGALTYTALLPFLLCAAVVSIILAGLLSMMQSMSQPTNEFAGGTQGGHPIQEDIASGDITTWLIVFVTACIAAPIIEETMFRGVFYRHLRDATNRWHRYWSVAFAALVNSLIFAAIHPQGIIGIPLLTTLAIGFSLTRQWRGSLIAPMVMHAINNGLVTCILFTMLL